MLNKVEIIPNQGPTLALPFGDVFGGYLVKEILGLSPVRANMVSAGYAAQDGEYYQASKREKRNLTLKLGLIPDYGANSVQNLRDVLYRYLMPKTEVRLRFHVGENTTREITVRVETFDSNLFAKEPDAVINMIGFNPDFYDPVQTTVNGTTTSTGTTIPIEYVGTIDTGIQFNILANRNMSGFTIHNQVNNGLMQTLEFVEDILSGDYIQINTNPGHKEAIRTSGAVISSILNGVSPYATWTKFEPGVNNFRVFAEGVAVPYSVQYTAKYGGL